MALVTKEEVLQYHSEPRPGKLEVFPIKPCKTQKALSMAYSPGVAEACLAISEDKDTSFLYTDKANLVGIISNGSAVLGLGNIGPEAAKPVMEGKAILFKQFADIDCYDIEIKATEVDHICEVIKALEPTFGAINLEDIKSPECFAIEERLKNEMNIPIFHDDQHGTAIISSAALLNALEIANKKIEDIRMVISGAGAAAIGCGRLFKILGVTPENIAMFDSEGHINISRTNLNQEKKEFATQKTYATIGEAMDGADCFIGCSVPGVITERMVETMAKTPIIFACANPIPEIGYNEVKSIRPDAIMATGRSDFPNQVNNVLGFPFIFRGAIDTYATTINTEMKIAAAYAIAALAKESVPESVCMAYNVKNLKFGPDYIIPKALDLRLLEWVAPAVAQAAIASGIARKELDIANYALNLHKRLSTAHKRQELLINSYGFYS